MRCEENIVDAAPFLVFFSLKRANQNVQYPHKPALAKSLIS